MENEKLNINEIVEIKQLPEIYYKLEQVGKFIDDQLKDLDTIKCDDDNKKIVKNRRTEINNTIKAFEDKRKEIKNKCLEEYNQFNDKYELEVKNKLENASLTLSNKIDKIEQEQIKIKKNNLIEFFKQYVENYHLEDIVSFEQLNLKINLSTSETSLKNEILQKLESISQDIKLINSEEYKEEILLEYKSNGFDFTNAKLTIINRHKEIEELQKKQQVLTEQIKEEEKQVEIVETLVSTPKEVIEEKIYNEITITLHNIKESKVKELQNYLKEQEIDYE